MKISLHNIGKRYNREWIFRGVNAEFESGRAYAILGANGSGKSTFLQVIAGNIQKTEGDIYYNDTKADENVYRYISFCSPYLELFEEFTFRESIKFQAGFKTFLNRLDSDEIIRIAGLEHAADKPLKHYSSGMKQRVKLALAILSNAAVLLLDEPASNLDSNGITWYNELLQKNAGDRLVIICSNQVKQEYSFCSSEIRMEDYKWRVGSRE